MARCAVDATAMVAKGWSLWVPLKGPRVHMVGGEKGWGNGQHASILPGVGEWAAHLRAVLASGHTPPSRTPTEPP